ncbi:arsenite efflux transporter metallochaperone ArsD [Pelosinus propionicus]|nr:arsenite efflux transporter metallochaperone ArsD [Pelosinus propionicus]
MKKIAIYDPAMCCSTGICGASIDKELLRVATIIENLKQDGADISRFNLSGEPNAFVENQLIKEQLKQNGPEILPITLVDGQIAKTKNYPTNEEFAQWTGLEIDSEPKKAACCCDESGCC